MLCPSDLDLTPDASDSFDFALDFRETNILCKYPLEHPSLTVLHLLVIVSDLKIPVWHNPCAILLLNTTVLFSNCTYAIAYFPVNIDTVLAKYKSNMLKVQKLNAIFQSSKTSRQYAIVMQNEHCATCEQDQRKKGFMKQAHACVKI